MWLRAGRRPGRWRRPRRRMSRQQERQRLMLRRQCRDRRGRQPICTCCSPAPLLWVAPRFADITPCALLALLRFFRSLERPARACAARSCHICWLFPQSSGFSSKLLLAHFCTRGLSRCDALRTALRRPLRLARFFLLGGACFDTLVAGSAFNRLGVVPLGCAVVAIVSEPERRVCVLLLCDANDGG